jgi:hypothetical protein
MLEIRDFSSYPQNNNFYGGLSCHKAGVTVDDTDYLVKYPGYLKGLGLKNVRLEISNATASEYIGSHIYEMLGIPVHETFLCRRNGKIAVACKDIRQNNEELVEFGKLMATFEEDIKDSNGNLANGKGTDLIEVLQVIERHPFIKDAAEVKERFWDMFVTDAFIGNPDRNNGNWGFIKKIHGGFAGLAPVFDNGNCLNCRWDDESMLECLSDEKLLRASSTEGVVCAFRYKGNAINPFQLIASGTYPECTEAAERISPRIDAAMEKICAMLHELKEAEIISGTQNTFFETILDARQRRLKQ